MADATIRGRFVWHELMTTDTNAAAAFYQKVIGWKTQAWEKDASYNMWVAEHGPVGGLMILPEDAKAMGAPPSWMFYLGTPDIHGTVDAAQKLGGRVLKDATEIPDGGRFAVLADPQGAVFGVFTSESAPAPEGERPKIGDFSWHELVTTDHQAALAFYQQLFGWENTGTHDMGPMGIYQMFGWGGRPMGGMYNKPPEMPFPPHWLCYAFVPDAGVAAKAAKAAGGRVVHGPAEVPGGDWITQICDPQGAAFAVHSKTVAGAAKPAPAPAPAPAAAPKQAPKPKPKPKPKAKPKPRPKAKPRTKPKARKVAPKKKTKKPVRKPARAKKKAVASKKRRR